MERERIGKVAREQWQPLPSFEKRSKRTHERLTFNFPLYQHFCQHLIHPRQMELQVKFLLPALRTNCQKIIQMGKNQIHNVIISEKKIKTLEHFGL